MKYDDCLTYLANTLFKKLCAVKQHQRYQASEALRHPWITRRVNDQIPMTLNDEMFNLDIKDDIKLKFRMMLVCAIQSYQSKPKNNFNALEFKDYKKKCKRLSKKIDKWHTTLL